MKRLPLAILMLAIIYLAYISLGLPDSVLGIAWPYMRLDFNKPLEMAGFLTIFGTICTALSSIMSGHVLARFGTGRVVFVSCLMTAIGLLGYSFAPSFIWIFAFLPFLGFGAGSIDCGLNLYVSANYSARHMTWLHCCWGIGATLGPIIATTFLATGFSWRAGYRTIGCIQLFLSIIFFASLGLWGKVQKEQKQIQEHGSITSGDELVQVALDGKTRDERGESNDDELTSSRQKAIKLQIAIYICYTSCEYLIGLWGYSLLVKSRGVDPTTAGIWVSFFFGSLTAARFATGFVVNRLGNRFMIKLGLCVSLLGIVLFAFQIFFPLSGSFTALAGIILMGAGFAPVYPCMTHETSRRFRRSTAQKLVGYQTGAASLGSAIFPALVGFIAARTSLEILPLSEAILVATTFILVINLDRLTSKGAL